MLFNSISFALFFLIVFGVYWSLVDRRSQLNWILISSFAFYAVWSLAYAIIFVGVISLNYWVSLAVAKRHSKTLLIFILIFDLTFLAWHKYAEFLLENILKLVDLVGSRPLVWSLPEILLPLGISFYTFQLIACVVDIYKGHAPIQSWRNFTLFVLFFPHQLAGPIFRIDELVPQFRERPKWSEIRWREGGWWIGLGLFKKVILADSLGFYVDEVFEDLDEAMPLGTLLAVYGFAFQIYFDFSGYSNIARGVGLLLGFDILHNFNIPYLAKSFREFWQRWHISLSRWLRDYLYIPLGGNREGVLMTNRNLLITMLLGGLWHGANWTFILWGGYHGVLLILNHWASSLKIRLPAFLNILIVFHLCLVGWIFFRAESWQDVKLVFYQVSQDMTGLFEEKFWKAIHEEHPFLFVILFVSLAGHVIAVWKRPSFWWSLPDWILAVGVVLLIFVIIIFAPDNQPFIYFQF
ncbi:MAG: MBOAT family protein [Verrucomicrobiae bacterium]|nr:MBOAT family protein [Verrucomicrobiae bacterium]